MVPIPTALHAPHGVCSAQDCEDGGDDEEQRGAVVGEVREGQGNGQADEYEDVATQ